VVLARAGRTALLKRRHIGMVAMAGVIGSGLFMGSGTVIRQAGPGAILAYAAAGLLVVLIMRMLGEMAATNPTSGSFSSYADAALGKWAGFTVGWVYGWFWVVVIGVDATAAALILSRWFPAIPQWGWVLVVVLTATIANLTSVRAFGEFEFWFGGIKVAAIVVFLGLGVVALAGGVPGYDSPGLANLVQAGGFFPNGLTAMFGAVVVVVFAYFGTEITTIAAAEADDPVAAVRSAVRSVSWRVLAFFVGSVTLIVALVPWTEVSAAESPFVTVMDRLGVPGASTLIESVILVSVLSCLNTGVYSSSRMAASLARRGEAPPKLGVMSSRNVPWIAVLSVSGIGLLSVVLNVIAPETVFLILLESSGAIALVVWAVIALSQLRMRARAERSGATLVLRMWGFPYLSWAVLVAIAGLFAAMAIVPSTRWQFVLSLALAGALAVIGMIRQRRHTRRLSARARAEHTPETPTPQITGSSVLGATEPASTPHA
jgi:GABA permease